MSLLYFQITEHLSIMNIIIDINKFSIFWKDTENVWFVSIKCSSLWGGNLEATGRWKDRLNPKKIYEMNLRLRWKHTELYNNGEIQNVELHIRTMRKALNYKEWLRESFISRWLIIKRVIKRVFIFFS